MRELRGTLTRLGVAAALILGASFAGAAPVISIDISAPDSGNPYDTYSTGPVDTAPNPDGTFSLTDQVGYGPSFNCIWSVTVNPDPQITSTFTLTNISGVTQNFVMNVTLPIAAIGPTTVQGGYFGATGDAVTPGGTTYTDANGDSNVTLNTVGANPFYLALVNGLASQGLGFFGPLGLNANGGPGVQGNLSQQLWGTPIPSAPFGPASGNIQIRWQFSLTAGDSLSTKGFFQVEPVPEPATALLIGLGLAGLVAARKRA